MMISTQRNSRKNPHRAALASVFEATGGEVEYLVIAHHDPRLVTSLSEALGEESAAVLEVSQDVWDFRSPLWSEAIEWGLEQGKVEKLVLVGSSQAAGAVSRASLLCTKRAPQQDSSYRRLVAGTHRYRAVVSEAQENFAEQVKELLRVPAVQQRYPVGEIDLHALFYRAESGIFLAYDAGSGLFRPLYSA